MIPLLHCNPHQESIRIENANRANLLDSPLQFLSHFVLLFFPNLLEWATVTVALAEDIWKIY